jgi:hypothetical protein
MMNARRLLTVPAVAFVMVMAVASPSFAATGSFPWTASFKVGLDSRAWTQKAGNTTITAKMSCNDPMNDTYYIELYRNETIDDSYGRTKYTCGSNQTYTWTSLPSGTYHFHLSKANDGVTISGNGTVTYPST